MTGYQSKRAAAQDKLAQPAQDKDHGDALTIAYQSGYYDGKKAAQSEQRTWVGLTEEEIDKWAHEIHGVIYAVMADLKERNT